LRYTGPFVLEELTVKPGSVVDSHSSRPAIAHWLKQPTRVQYGPYHVNPYLALLRVEFTMPRTVASRAVRSYRTLSPLPDPTCVSHRRFALCCTCRKLALPRRYLAPCPMEPGLSSPSSVSPERDGNEAATVWSTLDPRSHRRPRRRESRKAEAGLRRRRVYPR